MTLISILSICSLMNVNVFVNKLDSPSMFLPAVTPTIKRVAEQNATTKQTPQQKPSFDAVWKELGILNEGPDFNYAVWIPSEFFTLLEPDKDFASYVKDALGEYSVFLIFTNIDKPKKSDEWVVAKCRLLLDTNEKLVPISYKSIPQSTKEFIDEFVGGITEYIGKYGTKLKVVLFRAKSKDGTRYLDPLKAGSFRLLVNQSSVKFNTPIKSLSPLKTCVSCSFVLDSAWQYCPKCSKFIEKKK
jgi:hypothetical protein